MATLTETKARPERKPLPAPNSDFYQLAETLPPDELAVVKQVRAFMESNVAPIVTKYWAADEFPFELLPAFKALNLGGVGMQGYGCRGGSALWCDVSIIWARDLADNQVKGFIVENKTTPGFSVQKIQNKIALKIVQNGEITLRDCRVPEANRLQADTSFRDTARVLRMTRYLVGWEATGCQMGAYEHAVKYAQERLQFGKPIGSFQPAQELLGRMLANVTACQCMVARMAQLQAEGKLGDHHAALAKAFTTARMRETVAWAREIFGGNGIVLDYDVARFFADAEALYSYEGTYQMQNLIIGKAITDR